MKEKLARIISDWLGFSFLRLTIKERSDLTYKAYGFGLMPKVNYSVYLNWKNKNGIKKISVAGGKKKIKKIPPFTII